MLISFLKNKDDIHVCVIYHTVTVVCLEHS